MYYCMYFSAFKPELRKTFEGEVKVSEGKSVTLPCEIEGKPTPTVYWERNDQKMEGPNYTLMPNGNLVITVMPFEIVNTMLEYLFEDYVSD